LYIFTVKDRIRILDLSDGDLAVNGGRAARAKPWLDPAAIGAEEKAAVLRVMESGRLSLFQGSFSPDPPFSFYGGPQVRALERTWREHLGMNFAVAVNSATSGFIAAFGALGVGFGDEVIVPPICSSACALAPLLFGAIPVFADVEPETGALDPRSFEKRATPRTKAVVVSHPFGFPADMASILRVAWRGGIKVVEDCTQAHGARQQGKCVGTFGDVGVFSLGAKRPIQSGEGGLCVTNDGQLAFRLALLRNHGESAVQESGYEDIVNLAGFNFRMTEMQAAVAQEQIKKLDAVNKSRLDLAAALTEGIQDIEFLSPLKERRGSRATFSSYPLRFLGELAGAGLDRFAAALRAEGAPFESGGVRPHYLLPLFQKKFLFKHGYPFSAPENRDSKPDYSLGSCPAAEKLLLGELLVSGRIAPPNTLDDVRDAVAAIRKTAGERP
jgi:dTDP-4-amino-4,6-dideoxygalactose transaminase